MTHELIVLDSSGHTSIQFDPTLELEVARARRAFGHLKFSGYLAYTVDGAGSGAVVKEFDPAAATTILAPQMIGG